MGADDSLPDDVTTLQAMLRLPTQWLTERKSARMAGWLAVPLWRLHMHFADLTLFKVSAAAGLMDTEIRCFMKPEVGHGAWPSRQCPACF
ncbi:hypothetical protein BST63_24445 [Bradyrhizobium canariense]|uniref:Uncharacterized protein n=1 Tax=Bradyrhizobium canariense TaxID=255045 RepID=A0ABX3WY11_9BRAD|nr:hypothetical protein BSR47_10805 [Bradyrhizobium canariense]OSJ25059.1 hypothetical protein BST63_24445 [Bradyrhizobium canariense]